MSPDLPRRTVITGGIALTAAACSSSTAPGAPSAPGSTAPAAPASTAPGSTAPGSTAPAAPASTAAASSSAAGSLVKKSDVPVGGGYIMPKANFVVTQPTAGTYKAFSKICTHQSCPVSQVANGTINCTCHGSKFSVEDGSVKAGPATKPLPGAKVTESGDDLTISA